MVYGTDRAWSDQYIPAIKRIVGPLLLCESPIEVDQKQAADLIVMRARDMMIGCRVRRPGFAADYGSQFTIRCARDNGAKTELAKIVDGFGDWLFYGHAIDGEAIGIDPWYLIDLDAFRAHLIRDSKRHAIRHGKQSNYDGTHFSWFDITSFLGDPPLLVASSACNDT